MIKKPVGNADDAKSQSSPKSTSKSKKRILSDDEVRKVSAYPSV